MHPFNTANSDSASRYQHTASGRGMRQTHNRLLMKQPLLFHFTLPFGVTDCDALF
jgi:hypothetical protein